MHELSIVQSFAEMAERFAVENGAKKVYKVVLQIGQLTGVIPRYVTSYYPDVVKGTILEGSELVIEEITASVFCRDCGRTFNPLETDFKCPDCGSENSDVLEGKKLLLKEIAFD